ncbi:MAG: hypothetical protein AB1768_02475 [Pseudomonadota bacterium]|jgi:hypothetical protein
MAKHKQTAAASRPPLHQGRDNKLIEAANPLREPRARWQRFQRYTWDKKRG